MRRHDFERVAALLRERDRPRRLQDAVQPLQHGVVRQVQLVQQHHLPAPHRLDEAPVDPLEQRAAALAPRRPQRPQEVRRLRVEVAVQDPQRLPPHRRQQLARGRFAAARLAHEEHGLLVVQRRAHELHEARHRGRRRDVLLHAHVAHRGPGPLVVEVRLEGLRDARPHGPHVGGAPQPLREQVVAHQESSRLVGAPAEPLRPLEHVARGTQRRVAVEQRAALAAPSQSQPREAPPRVHELRRQRRGHAADALHDLGELVRRRLVDVDLDEAVAEGPRQGLAAAVLRAARGAARGVLRGEEPEVRVRRDDFARLREAEFPIIVQQPIQRLEDVRRRQVQFVQQDPLAAPHRAGQRAVEPADRAVRQRGVPSDVLRHVRVLVVVDARAAHVEAPRQVVDQRRLPGARRALQQNGRPPEG